MGYITKNSSILFALVAVLACVAFTTGCASSGKLSQPAAVPEIRPGVLAGYLDCIGLRRVGRIPPALRAQSHLRRGGLGGGHVWRIYCRLGLLGL